jgi:hypothetical protein
MNFDSFQFWAVTLWMVVMLLLAVRAVVALLRDGRDDQPAQETATHSDSNRDSSEGQNT